MTKQARLRVYTVIEVWRGIAIAATSFRTRAAAQRLIRRLKRKYNPMEDEIQLFEATI